MSVLALAKETGTQTFLNAIAYFETTGSPGLQGGACSRLQYAASVAFFVGIMSMVVVVLQTSMTPEEDIAKIRPTSEMCAYVQAVMDTQEVRDTCSGPLLTFTKELTKTLVKIIGFLFQMSEKRLSKALTQYSERPMQSYYFPVTPAIAVPGFLDIIATSLLVVPIVIKGFDLMIQYICAKLFKSQSVPSIDVKKIAAKAKKAFDEYILIESSPSSPTGIEVYYGGPPQWTTPELGLTRRDLRQRWWTLAGRTQSRMMRSKGTPSK